MRDLQTSACFVTQNRKLLGVVRDRDILIQVREGGTDLTKRLRPTPSVVKPDQHIAKLFEMAVDSNLPVAVIDDTDTLVGVVPRVTLLAALTDISTDTSGIPLIEPILQVPEETITETLKVITPEEAAAAKAAQASETGGADSGAAATDGEAR